MVMLCDCLRSQRLDGESKQRVIKSIENLKRKEYVFYVVGTNEALREIVQKLAETFNDPQIRETSYFDFYDDSLIIHGFPPNLPNNKDGFKAIYLSSCGMRSLI